MKESSKEKSIALVSWKETMYLISDLDESYQGEVSSEEITDEHISSTTLIVQAGKMFFMSGPKKHSYIH